MIVLLDLNFTLVGNSRQTFNYKTGSDIRNETYRLWLVDLLREHTTWLITARNADQQQATLESIRTKTGGWQPDAYYFKPVTMRYTRAAEWKRQVMFDHAFPQFGRNAIYLALESNAETRAMYAAIGIKAVKVGYDDQWHALPAGRSASARH